jgi:hypothetical protein
MISKNRLIHLSGGTKEPPENTRMIPHFIISVNSMINLNSRTRDHHNANPAPSSFSVLFTAWDIPVRLRDAPTIGLG